jgi:hypothetical protein
MTPSYSGDSNDWKMARLQMMVDMSLGSTAIRPSSICDSHEHNSKTHQDKVERHFNQKLASGEPLNSSQLPKGREHAQSTLTNRGTSQQVRSTLLKKQRTFGATLVTAGIPGLRAIRNIEVLLAFARSSQIV